MAKNPQSQKGRRVCTQKGGRGVGGSESNVEHESHPELAALIHSTGAKRSPEISKIGADRGNIVDRDPPYRREVHSME